jgi:hypothetical protein
MAPVRQTSEQVEFLALLCEDEDLLRAEFEAIIDANWAEPPPGWPVRPARPPLRQSRTMPVPQPVTLRSQIHGGMIKWVRQRSPPYGSARQSGSCDRQKGW